MHEGLLAAEPGASVGDLVARVAERLRTGGIPSARSEARDLVAAVLDVPRFWPSVNRTLPCERDVADRALAAADARTHGAPFAYSVGRAAFRHLTLQVDDRVLIPRQETEQLVELVLKEMVQPGGVVADVGTGSGAIALALATEGSFDRIVATDCSRDCIEVARANALSLRGELRCEVEFRVGSWLAPLHEGGLRAVVSNPPYIAYHEAAELDVSVRNWEPPSALYCGQNGMAAIARIVRDSVAVLQPGGLLALEVDSRRASLAAELVAVTRGYNGVRVLLDLAGRERFILAQREAE